MKRLTGAGHYVGASSTPSLTDTERGITYDRNGNLISDGGGSAGYIYLIGSGMGVATNRAPIPSPPPAPVSSRSAWR